MLEYPENLKPEELKPIEAFIDVIRLQSINTENKYSDSIQAKIDSYGSQYNELRYEYTNENLMDIVSNRMERNKFIIVNDRIYQNDDPIYKDPKNEWFFATQFYSPYKYMFGSKLSTYWANIIVIWCMALVSYLILYFDLLKKLLNSTAELKNRLSRK